MEKVVYLLGAGFSHPLGLPIMSDFIGKANNLLQDDPEHYGYFSSILKSIQQHLACITMFYQSDLGNIEEVFSILEMQNLLGKNNELDYSK